MKNSPDNLPQHSASSEGARTKAGQEHIAQSALLAFTKASGDSLRLNILRALRSNVYNVLELCAIFAVSQPAISHHLKILSEGGLVRTQRQGVYLFYQRAPTAINPTISKLQQSFWQALDDYALPKKYMVGIAAVEKKRMQSSMKFFTRNVDKFRTQQDLIAEYDVYAPVVEEALNTQKQHQCAMESVLEVGPGDGAFLSVLARYFNNITALDISQTMLNQARQHVARNQLSGVRFICGDTNSKDVDGVQVDCVVANMVLHHTPAPERVLGDMYAMLKVDGRLIITELCAHHQDWARDHLGDLWLGFDHEELLRMAQSVGFDEQANYLIGQSNGFQVQVREFVRPSVSKLHQLETT